MSDINPERYETIETDDGPVLVETQAWRASQERSSLERKMQLANVLEPNRRYSGEDVAGNIDKIGTYIKGFTSSARSKFRSTSLYLWSRKNGTQKSTVARYIGRSIIKGGGSAFMLLMSELAVELTRRGFENENLWLLEQLDEVDLLIVDDAFDLKKMTLYKSGYQIPFLDTFFRHRLEGLKKAICFTSNVPIHEISQGFGPSLQALISRSVPLPMEFNDEINDFDVKSLWD